MTKAGTGPRPIITLPSFNLLKTIQDIKATEAKENVEGVALPGTESPSIYDLLVGQASEKKTQEIILDGFKEIVSYIHVMFNAIKQIGDKSSSLDSNKFIMPVIDLYTGSSAKMLVIPLSNKYAEVKLALEPQLDTQSIMLFSYDKSFIRIIYEFYYKYLYTIVSEDLESFSDMSIISKHKDIVFQKIDIKRDVMILPVFEVCLSRAKRYISSFGEYALESLERQSAGDTASEGRLLLIRFLEEVKAEHIVDPKLLILLALALAKRILYNESEFKDYIEIAHRTRLISRALYSFGLPEVFTISEYVDIMTSFESKNNITEILNSQIYIYALLLQIGVCEPHDFFNESVVDFMMYV